ncbi:MAG TPA: methyltransferase domain-containing protein [Gemmatimonadota bacterium]|nr:methyltransferase domain-containing protein [Gemmatimonadota bacterium]
MILRPPRRRGAERIELMDAGAGSPDEIVEAYRLLDQVNHRLGGYRLTGEVFLPLARSGSGSIEILDVACGSGRFAARMARWARAVGRDPRVFVVDRSPIALAGSRGETGERPAAIRADALALPFLDRAVDVVHCSCFFHHLSTAGARDLLAEMCRVSRRAVIVNDLVRSRVAAAAIWTLSRALTDNRLVRADGPLSVLKAFLPRELLAIALAVGASDHPGFRWRIRDGFPYRMALVGVRVDHGAGS